MRICPNCAAENADSALFCISCGNSLKNAHTKMIPSAQIRRLAGEPEVQDAEEPFYDSPDDPLDDPLDDPDLSFDEIDEAEAFARQIERYKRELGPENVKRKSKRAKKEEKKIVLTGMILLLAVLAGGILAFNALNGAFSGRPHRTSSARLSDDMIKELTREKEAETELPSSGEGETAGEEAADQNAGTEAAAAPKTISASLLTADELDNTGYVLVNIASAEASSVIDQPGFDNSPMRAADGSEGTSWQEGVDGPGIGETIEFTFDRQYSIHSMTFKLGVWSTEGYFWKNNRPETMTIWFDDNGFEVTFPDGMEEYALVFAEDIPATSVHIEIDSVYQGTEYDDTCITEIGIYGV